MFLSWELTGCRSFIFIWVVPVTQTYPEVHLLFKLQCNDGKHSDCESFSDYSNIITLSSSFAKIHLLSNAAPPPWRPGGKPRVLGCWPSSPSPGPSVCGAGGSLSLICPQRNISNSARIYPNCCFQYNV